MNQRSVAQAVILQQEMRQKDFDVKLTRREALMTLGWGAVVVRSSSVAVATASSAYVSKLNEALNSVPNLAAKPMEDLLANLQSVPEQIRLEVRNNGEGHVNHVQFWDVMTPEGGGAPTGAVADAINSTFGSFEEFKEQMKADETTFGADGCG